MAESTAMAVKGSVGDPLAAGWDALRAGDWVAARECFLGALAAEESAEAFEGLGWATYCLDDDPGTFDARTQAFRRYRDRGDSQSAARVAAWLAADWLEFRGEPAVASGWLETARRLLDTAETGPGHGWLAVHEASMVVDEDPQRARTLAVEAVSVGRRLSIPELEMVGMGLEGLALVSTGDVVAGMRRLDEATMRALSGDAAILPCVAWACCYLIAACEQVRDYDRARQWCERVNEFCQRHGIALLLSVCKAKYAGVLTWQGRWDEAEVELKLAVDGLVATRPAMVGDALVRLGDLRRRQGRLDEAEELFRRCEATPLAILGRAEIALDRGAAENAAELADRYLRRFPDRNRVERCAGLEVAVRAHLRLQASERAEAALTELRDLAGAVARSRPLRAAALTAHGRVAAARGDLDAARCFLEDALDLLVDAEAPFETARIRVDLAGVLAAAGRAAPARAEYERALAVFRHIGARGEQGRTQALVGRLGPDTPDGSAAGPLDVLSPREREVLTLVADGLTNREIAERLVVSEHTVHRHVTSILRKLQLPSRAAAATMAARHGLV
jgi:LuxR family transcriptional regulator, maltose regulon positive regulatory protein